MRKHSKLTRPLYERMIANMLTNVPHNKWMSISILYKSSALNCRVMLYERNQNYFDTHVVLHIKSRLNEYVMHLPHHEDVFKDFHLPEPVDSFPTYEGKLVFDEIEAFEYPFQKAYTFLPKYRQN